jgi:hypothetical protein
MGRSGTHRVLRFLALATLSGAVSGKLTHQLVLPTPGRGVVDGARSGKLVVPSSSAKRPPPSVIHVTPADDLVQVLVDALAGDEIVFADGTFTPVTADCTNGTSDRSPRPCGLAIDKDIILRAQHPGSAVLDGQHARQVLLIIAGTVDVIGLNITRGTAADVSARILNLHRLFHAPWDEHRCLLRAYSLLAGRRCRCPWRHGHLRYLQHRFQSRSRCECSCECSFSGHSCRHTVGTVSSDCPWLCACREEASTLLASTPA